MQQIDIFIKTIYDVRSEANREPLFYEVDMPAIKIGGLLYLKDAEPSTIRLTGNTRVLKTYRIDSMEDMLSYVKADVLKHYPEEVRDRIVYTELK